MADATDVKDLLEILYRLGGGQVSRNVLIGKAKMHLDDWGDDRFWAAAQQAEDTGLISPRSKRGHVALTLKARREIEARMNPPFNTTTNNLNIGNAVNSSVQQAGALSNLSQITSYGTAQRAELEKFVNAISDNLGELKLDAAQEKKVKSQVATLRAQLDDDPDPIIVRQAGKTLRNIIEGAVGSLVGASVQPGIWHFVASVLSMFAAVPG